MGESVLTVHHQRRSHSFLSVRGGLEPSLPLPLPRHPPPPKLNALASFGLPLRNLASASLLSCVSRYLVYFPRPTTSFTFQLHNQPYSWAMYRAEMLATARRWPIEAYGIEAAAVTADELQSFVRRLCGRYEGRGGAPAPRALCLIVRYDTARLLAAAARSS